LTPNILIAYYGGQAPDDRGRYLADVQGWPDDLLESCHDFIQWMFPLRERSSVNPGAPTLDDATIEEFRSRPELRERLGLSFVRMMRFYGFGIQHGPFGITNARNFKERSMNWLSPGNHNHLRITRILKCLRLLGLEPEARAFFKQLAFIYRLQAKENDLITKQTFAYWQSAIQ
jgi:hypothetical protein